MTPLYLEHFGLREAPFSIAPDPRYLFMSRRHREAFAHLLYGVRSDDGFIVLTGEVGTGKTTLCRCLLEQLPAACDVALIFNPKLSVPELLSTVCEEFRIALPDGTGGIKAHVDAINAWLLQTHAAGRMAVLIIDEAQSLGADVLEQVRLLTNLETNRRKLLRIILLGQPQLRDLLARPDMAQLAQRIVARYHLRALAPGEVGAYVAHRMQIAGARRALFSHAALFALARLSGGTPRLLNVLCDRALLGAYVHTQDRVEAVHVRQAGREVLGMLAHAPPHRPHRAAVALGFCALCGVAGTAWLNFSPPAAEGIAATRLYTGPVTPAPPQTIAQAPHRE